MTIRPCIVIPVYNHAASAVCLIDHLIPLGVPILLVNDGSTIECAEILRAQASLHDQVDVLEHPVNRGKGCAVLTGFRTAHSRNFTHAVQIDADGQHASDDVPVFLALASRYPHALITGQPIYDSSVPLIRLMARYITHVCVWIETLSLAIPDSMCGFRVYPLADVMALANRERLGRRMDFDTDIAVRLYWDGVDVISKPTKVTYPEDGVSHFRMWRDNVMISWMHTRLLVGMIRRVPDLLGRQRSTGHAGLDLA